jgi:cold shock CspA family protein
VHISEVELAGLDMLREGMRIVFMIEQDQRSGKSKAVDIAAG